MLSAVCSKFQCRDINEKLRKFTWRIDNFSTIEDKMYYSEDFIVEGNKWRITIYPKGNGADYLSIYLRVADSSTLPSGWSAYAQFGFAVIDQIDRRNSVSQVATREFRAEEGNGVFGFTSFLPLNELRDPKRGYLVNDACLVEAYFSIDRTKALISHELMVETDLDKLKTEEAICAKAAIDNQKTMITEPEELTTPPPAQPSCQVEAIEPEEPTDEDMNTFFTSLESELSCRTVFTQEKAKEALATVEEALNRTPVNFYCFCKSSPSHKKAFKILASFYCSSTTLTMKQKNVLSAMEQSLHELADRAMKAKRDKDHLTEKESVKLELTLNLDLNLIRYKDIKSEVNRIEENLVALNEQVEEAHKEREKMLAEGKGIFSNSKRIKKGVGSIGRGTGRV
ncbi:protein RESTRICTED TEV MOVEMENT 3-like isoform X2 [Hibiscus syriacus]|uniref:protein RESTRICTED TEV MOVEMENT 3-like isoform X2 n=1 Tax=Hibiscus syriacus TaxID=106335 RepID=UPI0019232460|nr:protein RESTRICTED TEV MOVEMENT 3-like isoform X2 [Hibiscus syriacus]